MSSVSLNAAKYDESVDIRMGPVQSSTSAALDTGQLPPQLPPRSIDHKNLRYKLKDEESTDPTKKQLYALLLEEYKTPGVNSESQPQELVRRNSVSSSSLCSVDSSCTPPLLKDTSNSCDVPSVTTNGESRKRTMPSSSYHPKKKFLRGFQEETAAAEKEKQHLTSVNANSPQESSVNNSPAERPPSNRSDPTPPTFSRFSSSPSERFTPPNQLLPSQDSAPNTTPSTFSQLSASPSISARPIDSTPIPMINGQTMAPSTTQSLPTNLIPRNLRMRNVIESLMSSDVIRRHLEEDNDKYSSVTSSSPQGHPNTNYTQTSDVPGYQKALDAVFARRSDAQQRANSRTKPVKEDNLDEVKLTPQPVNTYADVNYETHQLHQYQQLQLKQKQQLILQQQHQQQQHQQQIQHLQQQMQQQHHHQYQKQIHQQQQHQQQQLWAQQKQILMQQKDVNTEQRVHTNISPTDIYRRAGYDSLPVNSYAVPYDHIKDKNDHSRSSPLEVTSDTTFIDLTSDGHHHTNGYHDNRGPSVLQNSSQIPPPLIAVKQNGAEIPLDLSMKAKPLLDTSPSLLQAYQNAPFSMNNLAISAKQRVLYSQPKLSKNEQKMPTTLAEPLSRVSSGGNSFLGNYPPNDILFLRCRICGLTYGSQHSIRKHFAKTHGFEPTADTVSVQSISATKKAMSERAAAANGPPTNAIHPPESVKPPQPPQYIDPNNYVSEYAIEYGGTDAIAAAMQMTANISKGKLAVRASTAASSKLKHQVYTTNGKDKTKSTVDNTAATVETITSTKEENDEKSMMRCLQCGKDFPTRDWGVFRRHVRAHDAPSSGATFRCTVCPAAFVDAASRRAHMSTSHRLTTCSCKVCDIGFTHIGALRKHLRTAHAAAPPGTIDVEYRCLYCPRSFSAQSDLETHTIRHEYDDAESINNDALAAATTAKKHNSQTIEEQSSTKSLLTSEDNCTFNSNVKRDQLEKIRQSPPPDSNSKDVGLLKKHLLAETKMNMISQSESQSVVNVVANKTTSETCNGKNVKEFTKSPSKDSKSEEKIIEEKKLEARRKTDLWFSKLSKDRESINSNTVHKPLEKGVFTSLLIAKTLQEKCSDNELKPSTSQSVFNTKLDFNTPSTSYRNKLDFRDLHTTLCTDHACEENYLRDGEHEHHHHEHQESNPVPPIVAPISHSEMSNSKPKFKAFDVSAALKFADEEKRECTSTESSTSKNVAVTNETLSNINFMAHKDNISQVIEHMEKLSETFSTLHHDACRTGIPILSEEVHSDSN